MIALANDEVDMESESEDEDLSPLEDASNVDVDHAVEGET